jgi:chloramphenicol O-acetyltransferase type A
LICDWIEVMAYVDLATWKHREHFEHFAAFDRPFFSLCVEVDVTAAWTVAREAAGASFFVASLYAASRAANLVEPMRTRVRDGRPWVHAGVAISTTVGRPDGTFGYARIEPVEPFEAFARHAQQVIDAVAAGRGLSEPNADDDVVYHSTLPWLRFSAFANAMAGRDSIPRIVFGKCVPGGGGVLMPVALEVHHAVVQGRDAARFYEQLQREFDALRDPAA